ncbi:cyclic lactone autoinducer peptide [Paenibacillus graminis]|nr:cyclic lactone autoinducer peptide [Paenibacillus graminis]
MIKKRIAHSLATVLSLVAFAFVNTASILYIHQPEVPEELLK